MKRAPPMLLAITSIIHHFCKEINMTPVSTTALSPTEQASIDAMQKVQDQAMLAGAEIQASSTSTQMILTAYQAGTSSTQKL
jgi:hypothetical protein